MIRNGTIPKEEVEDMLSHTFDDVDYDPTDWSEYEESTYPYKVAPLYIEEHVEPKSDRLYLAYVRKEVNNNENPS